jgi:DNA polymerase-3 subunit delta'
VNDRRFAFLPGFEELLGQDRPARLLASAVKSGNLPCAYLFTGPDGVGKTRAARTLAMALNCQRRGKADNGQQAPTNPCGSCRPCRKILSANHPDVHRLSPSGSFIRVNQVRDLSLKLALRSNEAETRLAIIEQAYKLNAEAGNSLLKILEEPPADTLFVLISRQASELLPTIASRCRHIRFLPIPEQSLRQHLTAHHALDDDQAAAIAAMAGGSLTSAAAMLEKDWMAFRSRIIEALSTLGNRPVNHQLAFSESLAVDTERLRPALAVMKSWFRDLAVYAARPEGLINKDLSGRIAQQAPKYPKERLISMINAIEKTESRIEANANARLAMDQLVISLYNKEVSANGENHRGPVQTGRQNI